MGVLIPVLAACGRINFDARSDGGGGGGDSGDDGGITVDARSQVTPPLPVSDTQSVASCPAIAWSGVRWGVAWVDRRDSTAGEIYFAALDANGTKIGVDVRVTNDVAATLCPAITWNGTRFLVVFPDERVGNFEIFGALISDLGVVEAGTPPRLTSDNGDSTQPTLGWNGTTFDLAWRDVRGVNSEVHYVRASGAGVVLPPEVTVSQTGVFVNVAALAETPWGAAVAWYDDSNGTLLRLSLLSNSIEQYDVSLGPATTGTGFTGPPAIAWTGSQLAVAWIEEPVSQSRDLVFANVDAASGVASSPVPLGVSGPTKPVAAVAGGLLGLVQQPGPRFVLRSTNGQPVDAPITLTQAAETSISSDDTRFAIAATRASQVQLYLITP